MFDSINRLADICLIKVILPKIIRVPKGFSKLKPFWVSEPPKGSRTMSTPTERRQSCLMILKLSQAIKGVEIEYFLNTHCLKAWGFLTVWTDLADFFYIVSGAIVDGVGHSSLGNGLMFGSRCCAKNGHIWHSLTQLRSRDTNTTCMCEHQQHQWRKQLVFKRISIIIH